MQDTLTEPAERDFKESSPMKDLPFPDFMGANTSSLDELMFGG